MSDLIDRQQAIDAAIEAADDWDGGCNIGRQKRIENYIKRLPPVQLATDTNVGTKLGTNLAEVGADLISRQAAMDALNHELRCGAVINQCGLEMAYEIIEDLPSANNSEIPNSQDVTNRQAVKGFPIDADLLMLKVAEEYGCMAYDRLYGIIRNMPKYELPPVLGTNLAEVGTDTISREQAIDMIRNHWSDFSNAANYRTAKACVDAVPSAEPKRGRWILDRSGAYCCSECMEPCATYIMGKPRDKFCKMCGSRNEVTE